MEAPVKAFGYLRVSGVSQIEGDGFPRQLDAIYRYANNNDVQIADEFREEGISGTKELEDRPALQALYAALEASPDTKTILIERLDRLARDLMVQETIISDLKKSGYTLISVAEPDLCIDDPSRKLMRQIFGAIAEFDRAMVVLKLRGARERTKAKTGRCEGNKPYGHYEGENQTLSDIQQMRKLGWSPQMIANQLNDSATPSRSGKPWNPKVVARILKRELNSTKQTAICA